MNFGRERIAFSVFARRILSNLDAVNAEMVRLKIGPLARCRWDLALARVF
jgi:hypothetical protein